MRFVEKSSIVAIMKVIDVLMARKKELIAEVESAMKELGAIEAALDAFKNIAFREVSQSSSATQSDLFEPARARNAGKMTIKDMILIVLNESESGLSAVVILDEINKRWKKDLVRTSLSPQLSRLKQEGRLIYTNQKWLLAEKDETSDAVTSEVRNGEVPEGISPESTTLPVAGLSSQVVRSSKEDAS